MNKSIFTELEHYGEILEKHFHDMMDVEFTVENGKLYILSARIGKRSKLANLKIVMSMFCEGKMSVEDVIKKIPYQQIEDLLDEENGEYDIIHNPEKFILYVDGEKVE